jgi:hypothetical protein
MNTKLLAFFIILLFVLKKHELIQSSYEQLIIFTIFCIIITTNFDKYLEHLEGSNEAIQTVASVYNSSSMTVKDLNITGNLTCSGTSKLGMWEVRGDKIGIKDRGDIELSPDKWVRLYDYGTATYNPCGFAGNQSWVQSGSYAGGTTTIGSLKIGGSTLTETNLKPLLLRKNNIAGYFSIRGLAYKIPLYYGCNMLWPDHNVSVNIVKNTVKSQKYIWQSYYDMRNARDNDQNWVPRSLIVFAGYIVRFYYWDAPSTAKEIFTEGEYEWPDNTFTRRVHLIFVSLVEEGPYPDDRNGSQMAA